MVPFRHFCPIRPLKPYSAERRRLGKLVCFLILFFPSFFSSFVYLFLGILAFLWVIFLFSPFSFQEYFSSSTCSMASLITFAYSPMFESFKIGVVIAVLYNRCLSTEGPVFSGFGTYIQCFLVRNFLFIFIHCIDHHHLFNKSHLAIVLP